MADVREYAGVPPVSAFADFGAPIPGGSPVVIDSTTGLCYILFGGVVTQIGATVTPSALTRTSDTNVTITLGGTPTTALLQAVSLTMGWSGQLSVARGGTNMSSNVAFLAYNSTADSNVTGAGTVYTLDLDTEVYDLGGNFAADTFTAPADGYYDLSFSVIMNQIDSVTATSVNAYLVTTTFTYDYVITAATPILPTFYTHSGSVLAFMNSGDTAQVQVAVSGMAGDTVDIVGASGTSLRTFFSGYRWR